MVVVPKDAPPLLEGETNVDVRYGQLLAPGDRPEGHDMKHSISDLGRSVRAARVVQEAQVRRERAAGFLRSAAGAVI